MELERWINVNELSSGRRLFAVRQMKAAAQGLGQAALVQKADEAMAHDRHTRELDMRWAGHRNGNTPPPTVARVDNRVDSAITGLRDGAVAQTKGAAPEDPIHAKVEGFLQEVLPAGVFAVTSLPVVEQLAAVENIVSKLEGPQAATVAELGLQRQAGRLSGLVPVYREAIESAMKERITFPEVRAARRQGQRHLLALISMVLGAYPSPDDPAHQDAREALLGPIAEQNEAVRAYLRGRRSVRDIDPDTGDLDPDPGTPEAGAPEPAPEPPAETAPAA